MNSLFSPAWIQYPTIPFSSGPGRTPSILRDSVLDAVHFLDSEHYSNLPCHEHCWDSFDQLYKSGQHRNTDLYPSMTQTGSVLIEVIVQDTLNTNYINGNLGFDASFNEGVGLAGLTNLIVTNFPSENHFGRSGTFFC